MSFLNKKGFETWRYQPIKLELIKDRKRMHDLYHRAKKALGVDQSIYKIAVLMLRDISNSALNRRMKELRIIDNPYNRRAFLMSNEAKTVVVNELHRHRINSQNDLYNLIQTFNLLEIGVNIEWEGEKKQTPKLSASGEGIKVRKPQKPTPKLRETIELAQKNLKEAGLPDNDPYLIVRELNDIANKRYTGDNYFNQLKRVGITSTIDYLNYVEYVLENPRRNKNEKEEEKETD